MHEPQEALCRLTAAPGPPDQLHESCKMPGSKPRVPETGAELTMGKSHHILDSHDSCLGALPLLHSTSLAVSNLVVADQTKTAFFKPATSLNR
jgi:hypothetical protein